MQRMMTKTSARKILLLDKVLLRFLSFELLCLNQTRNIGDHRENLHKRLLFRNVLGVKRYMPLSDETY